jgi:hypothetical protein
MMSDVTWYFPSHSLFVDGVWSSESSAREAAVSAGDLRQMALACGRAQCFDGDLMEAPLIWKNLQWVGTCRDKVRMSPVGNILFWDMDGYGLEPELIRQGGSSTWSVFIQLSS